MSSTTALMREALVAWASALPLGLSHAVSADEGEPGEKQVLPTLSALWAADSLGTFARRITQVGDVQHEHWGEVTADVWLRWRLGSSADAEKVHAEFRRQALKSATGDTVRDFESMVIPVRITLGGATYTGRLYLTGERQMAAPEDTQVRDLWAVAHGAKLRYPEVFVETAEPLAVSVEVGGTTVHLGSGSYPIQSTPDL